jgi:hypothetical protein
MVRQVQHQNAHDATADMYFAIQISAVLFQENRLPCADPVRAAPSPPQQPAPGEGLLCSDTVHNYVAAASGNCQESANSGSIGE